MKFAFILPPVALLLLWTAATAGEPPRAQAGADDRAASPVKSDESVILFPSYGRADPETGQWRAVVHGWIFEPEPDSMWRSLALGSLRSTLGLAEDAQESAVFRQRAATFLVDNERGKEVVLWVAGQAWHSLPSQANGHFRADVRLSRETVEALCAHQGCQDRLLEVRVVLPDGDDREVAGAVFLVRERGLSVVSDIDDTWKVSEVTDKSALLANTFLRPYAAVAGMAELYTRWRRAGAAFHYLSSSPWQLYPGLEALRASAGLPPGTFHLKDFRWKDESFFNLFTGSASYKGEALRRLLADFPGRRFLLVGDSGEEDPEIYGEVARAFPTQVVRVFIRNVTGEDASAPRYRTAFRGLLPGSWQVFLDPAEVQFGSVAGEGK